MKKTNMIAAAVLVGTLGVSSILMASGNNLRLTPYSAQTQTMIEEQMLDGAVIVTKDGCPVCKKQVAALEMVLKQSEFASLKIHQINFKDPLASEKFKANRQSTIIVYKDGKEVSRTTGLTDSVEISNELKKAI